MDKHSALLPDEAQATLAKLKPSSDQPDIHILATSLTSGTLCKFTSEGFVWFNHDREQLIRHTSLPVSLAVAASSAFPPLFPPIAITNTLLGTFRENFNQTQYLTDGGVFDNLGLSELARLSQALPREHFPLEKGLLIISDAGGVFDWQDKAYSSLVSRNIRASDILMDRVTDLVPTAIEQHTLKRCVIKITAEIDPALEPNAQNPEVQRATASIRTDLDCFSNKEVIALLGHGYAQARFSLRNSGINSDEARPWSLVDAGGLKRSETVTVQDLRSQNAGGHRWRLFAKEDWVSGLVGALLLLWLMLLVAIPIKLTTWFAPYLLRLDLFFPTKEVQILDDFVFVKFEEYQDSLTGTPFEKYRDPQTLIVYPVFDKATYVEHVSLRRTRGEYKIVLGTTGIPPEIKSIAPAPDDLQPSKEKAGTRTISAADLEPEPSQPLTAFSITPDVKTIYVYRNGFQGQKQNSWGGKNVAYDTDRLTFVYDFSSIAGWQDLFRVDPDACLAHPRASHHGRPDVFNWDSNRGVAIVEAYKLKKGDKVRIFWTWNRRPVTLPPYPTVKCENALQ